MITIDLAGIPISIDTPHINQLSSFLQGYLHNDDNDNNKELFVSVTEEDIISTQEEICTDLHKLSLSLPDFTPLGYELLALHRKLLTALVDYRIIYLHGSAFEVDNQGYLFCAPSGTGKSTHARLWRERYGEKVRMINDDKPLLKVTEDGNVLLCGNPWNGKHGLGENCMIPLKAVVFLHRAEQNSIVPCSRRESLKPLYLSTYHFEDSVKMKLALEVLGTIVEKSRFYNLYCNMEPEAAEVAYEGLVGESDI